MRLEVIGLYAKKLELKLNNQERSKMAQCAGYARFVDNYGLSMVNGTSGMTKVNKRGQEVSLSYALRILEAKKVFTDYVKKQPEYVWTSNYSSRIYQSAFQHLGEAFKRYKEGISKYPKLKRKKDRQSFTVYDGHGKVTINPGKKIKIPTLGTFRLWESIPYTTASQTFTISRTGEKWFVSFSIEASQLPVHPLLDERQYETFGIDVGVKQFASITNQELGNSEVFSIPDSIKIEQLKLAKFQWRNRNKQLEGKGKPPSKNAIKYYKKQALYHGRVVNIHRDFIEKTTTNLASKVKHVCLENLNVKGMMQNGKLAASIARQGFYEFRQRLTTKIVSSGGTVVLAPLWFPSSKTCHNCGYINQELKLKDRTFDCPDCGMRIDRDLNAAMVLSQYGEVNQNARG
ncbi:RNA-guided endonuclease TnpB family protein [Hydrocoleum sp. CS-953]|uniref:RNA-guided endonuclease InsQ/TnpB family protein n=1 Tax=Hydrocoleum sp. CS-953 TaxID=1671698 RepID=UPI000B9A8EB3|nr:RNA-guided endonuclease TnpB family protein [Hydrocoleum sp. CS-953]